MNRKCILIGDFNCDLLENSSARAETFLSVLPIGYSIVPKDRNYSFISTSGNASNLDHVVFLHPHNLDLIVKVSLEGEDSDHIPLFLSFPVRDTPSSEFIKRKSKYLRIKSWDKIDKGIFQGECDFMLDQIRVPFQWLQRQPGMDKSDIRNELNLNCALITHTLKNAEKFAVPVRTSRSGTEKFGWSNNESLKSACQALKFWLRLWNDCDKLRNGVVNTLRLLTKRHFQKELKAYRVGQNVAIAESITNDPNKLWKTRLANNKTRESKITISENHWHSDFKSQFTEPDVNILKKFETDLNNSLRTPGPGTFVVSSSDTKA